MRMRENYRKYAAEHCVFYYDKTYREYRGVHGFNSHNTVFQMRMRMYNKY